MNLQADQTIESSKLNRANVERYSVFIFGVVFMATILILSVWIPEPTKSQFFTFKLVISLAAAGIGALLPGFVEFKTKILPLGTLRAGGAIGLFLVIWYTDPAKYAIDEIAPPPDTEAEVLFVQYLNLLDSKDYRKAYTLYAKDERKNISENTFTKIATTTEKSLGKRIKGPEVYRTSYANEFNGQKGHFVATTYESRFETQSEVWMDTVIAIAEDGEWKIYAHNLAPCLAPNCSPMPGF